MNREELIHRILDSRARLEEELAKRSPAQLVEPNLPGGWSPRDMLAHIGWWERRVVDIYRGLKGETPFPDPIDSTQLDEVNARTFEQHRNQPVEEVRGFEHSAYQDLMSIVRQAPDSDLFDPQQFEKLGNQPFMNLVIWNTYDHYDEHLATLVDSQIG